MGAPQSAQSKALVDLLKTGKYSDLTISCGKDQYHVHKAIICPRSNFFEAAFSGEFKEAQTGEIDLPDDDPIAVRMIIEYLYHDTYMPPPRDGAVDTPPSAADNSEERDKSKRELCDATVPENKRLKGLPSRSEAPIAPISQPVPSAFGAASTPPPPPPAASREHRRGSDRGQRIRDRFASLNLPSGHNSPQAFFNQSQPAPRPNPFASPAPASTPPPPQQPSSPRRPAPPANLHLHAKVYALGEKYSIEPLEALALSKFESDIRTVGQKDDFLAAIREAYTSTIETDRPLRDAVVAFLRKQKHLLKRDYMKAVLKETALGFDLLMKLASE